MAEPSPKRKAEEVDGEAAAGEAAAAAAAKRQRLDNGAAAVTSPGAAGASAAPAAAAAAAAAPGGNKLGIDLDRLAKAKAALLKQKELAAKLAKAGITVR